jgi:hypothetical protein
VNFTPRPVLDVEASTALLTAARTLRDLSGLRGNEFPLQRIEERLGLLETDPNIARSSHIAAPTYHQNSMCSGLGAGVSKLDGH